MDAVPRRQPLSELRQQERAADAGRPVVRPAARALAERPESGRLLPDEHVVQAGHDERTALPATTSGHRGRH